MGKIIVIEGTDCSGKETQSKLLVEKLNKMGIKAIQLSFPMYETPTGKIVGGAYLGKEDIGPCLFPEGSVNLDPKIASLYYAADRKYNIKLVKDYIKEDYIVVLDRYVSSNMAHQGCKIIDKDERFKMFDWIDKLEYWLLELPKPELTIFLYVPHQYSFALKKERKISDNHEKDENYLINAENTYLELSGLYNWKTINCIKDEGLKSITEINEEIIKYLDIKKD
ncbi:MAG: thymidylate kinase [Bacilli bacterium]